MKIPENSPLLARINEHLAARDALNAQRDALLRDLETEHAPFAPGDQVEWPHGRHKRRGIVERCEAELTSFLGEVRVNFDVIVNAEKTGGTVRIGHYRVDDVRKVQP